MNTDYRLAELERRLVNLVRLGKVTKVDAEAAKVKVESGELATGWLSWLTRRAGADADWWSPEVGEQVILLSPDGDPAQAVVLPALYQAAFPAPERSLDVRTTIYADGTVVTYDRKAHHMKVDCVGSVELHAAKNVKATIDGDLTATVGGNITGEAGGAAKLKTGGKIEIEAAGVKFTVSGKFEVQASNLTIGDTVKDGKGRDSSAHTHPGVQAGSASTGPAQ